MRVIGRIVIGSALAASMLVAQQLAPPKTTPGPDNAAERLRPTYILGPGDQIVIRAFEVEEIMDKPFRIGTDGDINIPVLGVVHAAGLTVEELESELLNRLKTFVKTPQVSVSVVEFRSEPVFLQGAFKTPGIYTLQGRRTLLQMLASSGGLLPNASQRITVTRHLEMGVIPLPNAIVDQERKMSTVEISVARLRENMNPLEDITLQPLDTVTVNQAEPIYVTGEFNKVGTVELGERDSISVTQLVSMAGGLSKDAVPDKARILRSVLSTQRRAEIPVNLKKVLLGKEIDISLFPNDVLYVPKSSHGEIVGRLGLIAIPAATSLIYVLATKL